MKTKILQEDTVYNGWMKVKKAKIARENFNGRIEEFSYEKMTRGDAVAVLVWDYTVEKFILTKQFRYPTMDYILEIVAGNVELEESPEETAKREVLEEIGYDACGLEKIYEFYTSPGRTDEKIYLFYAEVESGDKSLLGGGLPMESEDILAVYLSRYNAVYAMRDGIIKDAKTIIALQWFMNNY